MSIVGAFDVHRRQLTFEYLDTSTGVLKRGRVIPADREHLREWLARFAGQDDVHFALEGCTGWRYVAEELAAAGITPHLAEPADTAALRGKKRHAKTGKTGTVHLRVHLMAGDLPECWIPPEHVLRPGRWPGCIRTCSMSAAPGISRSPPPCSIRASR